MRGSLVVRLVITVLSLAFPLFAEAQTPSQPSLVSGTVIDASGASVGGASVTLRVGAVERHTATDGAGHFTFDGVPSGRASVTVMVDKFAPVTVDLTPTRAPVRIILQPENVSETVTVVGSRVIVSSVTSATKTETPLRDLPQSVSIVTKELIAEQRMQGMADVVRYMPGVGIAQGEGNRDTPILRGNATTSDFFVDGIRDDVQYFRDLYNVDHVEALKGPNAMMFGRGGVGGVINRVSRQAEWQPAREVSFQFGSWNNRRLTADLGRGFNDKTAARLTTVYENSDSYRDGVGLERYGVNPTLAFALGPNTTLRAGYEYFHDSRTADRGISSFNGLPVATDPSTFFGNPDQSHSDATINVFSSLIEHKFANGITLRNRVSYGNYDKFYQNVFPGAVNTAGTTVSLSAYNNATDRRNLFDQTDVILSRRTGRLHHTLLTGAELGRQVTDNFRTTGFFSTLGPAVTTISVPLSNPTTSLPLEYRQSASDADNHGIATNAAVYAQDQVAFGEHVQALVGLRFESFNVDFRNNRMATDFSSSDGLLSPRLGLIYKPATPVSIYGSYSLSYLPRAGEQLSSLSLSNQALDPEEFRNYEVGAKWDVAPTLAFTAALYRLDRGNVVVPDPIDPTLSLLVDAQRTKGLELGLGGRVTRAWSLIGGYAYQDGKITRALSATVQAGAVLPQLPKHSFSLWSKYDLSSQWGIGLGLIHRSDVFTSTDNSVILPGFVRVDAGVFFNLNSKLQAQLNVENLLDKDYYASAHSNTNITPGSPRAVRVALTTRF
jgi:catecholate siderophore receptor